MRDAIETVAELESLYGEPNEASTVKVASSIDDDYAALIRASPFVVLGTVGPEGLDCSPRGDRTNVARIVDPNTLQLPDRRGNDRIDSLRNIVRDPRVGLLFLLPGSGTTVRVNGRARIRIDPALLASFETDGKRPRCVVEIAVGEVYFQCARAIVRSELWNPERHVDTASLPTPGDILARRSSGRVGGGGYDRGWKERADRTLW